MRKLIDGMSRGAGYLKRNRRRDVRKGTFPMKINLGCGLAVAPGWLNVDGSLNALFAPWPKGVHKLMYRISGANRYYTIEEYCQRLEDHDFVHHDLSYGIPFADNVADFVYSSHFLEHLDKAHGQQLIREMYRVLEIGGVARICVPNLEYAMSLYMSGDKERMLCNYFFVEEGEGYYARHKYMYDFELLSRLLYNVGFREVVQQEYQVGRVPDLTLLDNRPEETLYVEAIK